MTMESPHQPTAIEPIAAETADYTGGILSGGNLILDSGSTLPPATLISLALPPGDAWKHSFFPLTFAEYQAQARTTAFVYQDAIDAMDLVQCRAALKLAYSALGFAGEAGETANKVKKIVRGDGVADQSRVDEILKELGGALWYMADIATNLGACLGEDVARANLVILSSRQERGVLKGNGDNR